MLLSISIFEDDCSAGTLSLGLSIALDPVVPQLWSQLCTKIHLVPCVPGIFHGHGRPAQTQPNPWLISLPFLGKSRSCEDVLRVELLMRMCSIHFRLMMKQVIWKVEVFQDALCCLYIILWGHFPIIVFHKILLLALSETRYCLVQPLIWPDCSCVLKYPFFLITYLIKKIQ